MQAWSTIQIPMLAAGLGLFLFGVSMLEEAIKSLAGRSFKLFLQKQTGHPLKAVVAGALTTAVMTSSSTVTLLVMSFTGSGILPLQNGIGLILGANLGTTFTGWMVALLGFTLNPEKFFLLFTAAGALGLAFLSTGRLKTTSKLILGFGLLFLGLNYMKDSLIEFASKTDLTLLAGKPWIFFVLVGFVLAAALRSSTAAMVIFLTSLSAGTISLMQACYLAIGADLGTTMTGLLGTINGNVTRKKTGWAQFYINVITAVVTLVCLHPLLQGIEMAGIHNPLVALVSFHSSFNLLGILLIVPFIQSFTRWIDTLGSGKTDILTSFLSPSSTRDVIACIDALERESLLFIQKAIHVRSEMYNQPSDALPGDAYYALKEYENVIFNYSLPTLQQSLNKSEAEEIQQLYSSIRSATLSVKEIKDIRHNIADFRQSARDDLFALEKEINHFFIRYSQDLLVILNQGFQTEMLQDAGKDNEAFYDRAKAHAFEAYHKKQDFDLASLLNFIREVRDSNQLIIKSIELLWSSIQNKTTITADNG